MTLRSTKVGFDSHLWRAMTYMVPTCDFLVSIHQICGTSWLDPQLSTVRHIFYFPITVLLVQKTCSCLKPMSIWCFESSAFAQSNSCVQAGFIMNGLYLSMPKKKEKTILKKSMVCWIHLSKKTCMLTLNIIKIQKKKLKIHQFLWSHHLVFSVFSSWLASKFMLTMSEGTLGAPDLGNLGMDETCGYGF